MAVNAVVDGRIVAEPEIKHISDKFSVMEFPLYSDRRIKNRDTGEWESDPNGTTKLKVVLKFDQMEQWQGELNKGDIIKVTGRIYERAYEGKNGPGRSLETDYVESIEVIRKSSGGSGGGMVPAGEEAPW